MTEFNDNEINVMHQTLTLLNTLDDIAQKRVLNWLSARLSISVTPSNGVKTSTESEEQDKAEDISDYMACKNPSNDQERVLLVATFLQEKNNKQNLTAFEINTELKHLGHSVNNITSAISGLINSKPQLMIQLRKEGKSKQAKKKYKVTREGILRASQMGKVNE
jgi:hypothetical protein